MSLDVIQIRNPAAFDVPEIRALFERAFTGGKPVAADIAIEEFREIVGSPLLAIAIGTEDGEFRGLAILMDRDTRLFMGVTVYHFFNEGSEALRAALVEASIAFSRSRGYDKIWAVNATGRSDKVWSRTFAGDMVTRKIGSIMEVDLGGGDA